MSPKNKAVPSKLKAQPRVSYRHVKNHIVDNIRSERLQTGDRIASEHTLVERLGVSRMTVIRALRELVSDGVLTRVNGVGTFVAEARKPYELLRIGSIAEDVTRHGNSYSFRLVSLKQVPAPFHVAMALQQRVDGPVYHSICVHKDNDAPIQIEDRYVNPAVSRDYIEQDFVDESPGEFLYRTVALTEIEHVVQAEMPTRAEMKLLECDNEPCLVVIRKTWSNDIPATLSRLVHPSSRYRLASRFATPSQLNLGK